jgi:hypothetical protein
LRLHFGLAASDRHRELVAFSLVERAPPKRCVAIWAR